jgi:hypothetical protein
VWTVGYDHEDTKLVALPVGGVQTSFCPYFRDKDLAEEAIERFPKEFMRIFTFYKKFLNFMPDNVPDIL